MGRAPARQKLTRLKLLGPVHEYATCTSSVPAWMLVIMRSKQKPCTAKWITLSLDVFNLCSFPGLSMVIVARRWRGLSTEDVSMTRPQGGGAEATVLLLLLLQTLHFDCQSVWSSCYTHIVNLRLKSSFKFQKQTYGLKLLQFSPFSHIRM